MVVMGRDPDTVAYTTIPHPYERRHAEEWVAEPGKDRATTACWAVEADDGGTARFAGTVDLRGHPTEIGYVLAPWARGRGHMTRAVRLAVRWAFEEAGLPVVHWRARGGEPRVVAGGARLRVHVPRGDPARDRAPPARCRDAWLASLHRRRGQPPAHDVVAGRRPRGRAGAAAPARPDADVPRISGRARDPRTRVWLPTLPQTLHGGDGPRVPARLPRSASHARAAGHVGRGRPGRRPAAREHLRVRARQPVQPHRPARSATGRTRTPAAAASSARPWTSSWRTRSRRSPTAARPPPAADRLGLGQRGEPARGRARRVHPGRPVPRGRPVDGAFGDGAWYERLRHRREVER